MRFLIAAKYTLLALLVASATAQAQAKPVIRSIATLIGPNVYDFAVMPNGRVMYYVVEDSLLAYDLAAKRATLVARGEFDDLSVSARGNRIVFDRENEDGSRRHVWTMPVDSVTGAARASAQRVSTRPGHEPRISPDGRTIAFITPVDSSPDVFVVPVTGGPERNVGHFPTGVSFIDWTPDSKSLYVHLPATARSNAIVQRISIDGGSPETLMSIPVEEGTSTLFDGDIALFRPDRTPRSATHLSYRGIRGEQGEFEVPTSAWGRVDPVGGRNRRYVFSSSTPSRVFQVDLSTGMTKPLAAENDASRTPAFSLDGKMVAFLTSVSSPSEITVVNTDGSAPRRFALPITPAPFPLLRWSPDSRRIAFWADRRQVLAVLDISTGKTTVVHRAKTFIGAFTWTERGDGFRFWQPESFAPSRIAIYELPIGGTPKHLRDMPSDMTHRGMFVSPSLIEYASNSSEFIVPVAAGEPRRLPVDAQPLNGVPSDHGNWWAFLLSADAGRRGRVQIVNAQGDTSRIIDLPFETFRTPIPINGFLPGHRSLVMVGRTIGDKAYKLFNIPIDGTAPREIATLSPDYPVTNLVLARDGRSAAYTVTRPEVTTIYEVDVRPLIQTAAKPKASR